MFVRTARSISCCSIAKHFELSADFCCSKCSNYPFFSPFFLSLSLSLSFFPVCGVLQVPSDGQAGQQSGPSRVAAVGPYIPSSTMPRGPVKHELLVKPAYPDGTSTLPAHDPQSKARTGEKQTILKSKNSYEQTTVHTLAYVMRSQIIHFPFFLFFVYNETLLPAAQAEKSGASTECDVTLSSEGS